MSQDQPAEKPLGDYYHPACFQELRRERDHLRRCLRRLISLLDDEGREASEEHEKALSAARKAAGMAPRRVTTGKP